MSAEPVSLSSVEEPSESEPNESKTLRVLGWFSAGMALATLGIYLGFELRSRYKFKRRTPYDFYSNAAEPHSAEFGMGV